MRKIRIILLIGLIIQFSCFPVDKHSESTPSRTVNVMVDFGNRLQDWDGFGVNYVEVAQSQDYAADPQEYGGFSRLNENQRQEILELIFGENGLKPNIIKMFFDPFHQKKPGGPFDHETTTRWMRYFAHQGVSKTAKRGSPEIEIITTMYGPPAWATKQKILRGRDLDPYQYENLAKYMIDWTRFLVKEEKLPVKYLSLHNEGDSPNRWPLDGSHGNMGTGHDYNAFWRPHEVAYFLEFMPPMIKKAGLDVGLTPGECSNWLTFETRCYHWTIHDNEKAMNNMALITSHGFGTGERINSNANDLLRMRRPELHSWTTSMTWGGKREMKDFEFINYMRRNIYDAKVNAIIPWAALQTLTWVGGDPNPGTAFFISEDGEYEIRPQYYYYKQLCPVGQRGMKVVAVKTEEDSGIELIAFCANNTENPDAFLIINLNESSRDVRIQLKGSTAMNFTGTRSSANEKNIDIGGFEITNGIIQYNAPAGSVSTFTAVF
jgi:O-glycosyl hydrolase